MAPPLTVVVGDKGSREWKPAEFEDDATYSHLVEIAKTSRARCRRCSEFIAKATLRVGVPIKWRGGEYGWISSWQHPQCLRVPDVSRAELATQMYGLNALSVTDRTAVLDELLSKTAVALETVDPDDLSFSKRDGKTPPAKLPTPAQLTRPLLPFQQEGLAWMVDNEQSVVNGGILADEMGMGKTIQTIALLLHQKATRIAKELALAKKGQATSSAGKTNAPTLVIVPTSALTQWEDEIRDCVTPGSLSVVVYYSNRAKLDAETLNAADVVLTTYPVVEGEWRKCVARAMVPCKWCAKKLLPRSLVTHLKYFCGPDAVRSAKLAKRETKQDAANEKAMRTLRIKKGDGIGGGVMEDAGKAKRSDGGESAAVPVEQEKPKKKALPTPGNFYKELMTKAGRPAMSMYDGAIKARRNPRNPGGSETKQETKKDDDDGDDDDDNDLPVSDSDDVIVVGEFVPCVKREPVDDEDADDEMLRVALELSRREAQTRLAGSGTRTTRGSGKQLGNPGGAMDTIDSGKKQPTKGKSGAATRPSKGKSNASKPAKSRYGASTKPQNRDSSSSDDDDDDEWIPNTNGGSPGNDADAQLALAISMEHDEDEEDEEDEEEHVSPEAKLCKGKGKPAKRVTKGAFGGSAVLCLPVDSVSVKSEDTDPDPDPDADPVDLSDSTLHNIVWDRIVLDEAHKIKARTTNTAKCVYDLRSEKKWCLSGTPLQNRVGELYSLVRFLRMDPHAYYFCKVKGCECKSLCWNFGPEQRRCAECGHAGPRHYSHFNQTVINPINRYGYVGDGKKGFLSLRDDILRPAQLRRTKADVKDDVKLPYLTINVESITQDEVEKDFYESLYMLTRAKFDGYVAKGSVLHNYAHIFELLSRLRQTCDHPYLVVHSKSNATKLAGVDAAEAGSLEQSGGAGAPGGGGDGAEAPDAGGGSNKAPDGKEGGRGKQKQPAPDGKEGGRGKRKQSAQSAPAEPLETEDAFDSEGFEPTAGVETPKHYCGICADSVEVDDAALTGCGHVFHVACITEYASCAPTANGAKVTCPACRVPLTVDLQPADLSMAKRIKDAASSGEGKGGKAAKGKGGSLIPSKSILSRIDLGKYTSSTKVESLMAGLRLMRDEDAAAAKAWQAAVSGAGETSAPSGPSTSEPSTTDTGSPQTPPLKNKAIIFSQYTSMIEIVEWRLRKEGFVIAKLLGSMPVSQRAANLRAFRTDPEVTIILMSLKSGGEGLNLQTANRVFILEPWWNPAVEMQAVMRAHRIGQKRAVVATRFCTKDTIETRMFELQEKKRLVFEGCMDGNQAALAQLTEEDLQFLFKR